jgi:hypothetical protein
MQSQFVHTYISMALPAAGNDRFVLESGPRTGVAKLIAYATILYQLYLTE